VTPDADLVKDDMYVYRYLYSPTCLDDLGTIGKSNGVLGIGESTKSKLV